MSYGNQYNPNYGSPYGGSATYMQPVATLDEQTRSQFIVKVYQHLLAAVVLFVMFETLLFSLGVAEGIYNFLVSTGGMSWLLIMGGFMVVSWFATQASHDMLNPSRQYLGMFALAAGEAVIFAPMLYFAFNVHQGGSGTVASAAVITGMGFMGLTAVAMTTRHDLSWIRPILMWGFMGALVLIVAAVLFGWSLGVWFSVGMIVLAGGAILYQTQNIIREYPSQAYVGAAVQLFASVMLLFWYVLQLLLSLTSD
jgi:uncharacterized protein